MLKTTSVLDHGFVRIHNIAGPTRRAVYLDTFDADDADPANTARMSYDEMDGDRTREADLKLADYLMKNKHTSPFEMIEIWVEMKLPIFVARQWVRHRTASLNEVSGRYVQLPPEWYVPEPQHVGMQATSNKQGRELFLNGEEIQLTSAQTYCEALNRTCRNSYAEYELALEAGIPTELARLFLHLNHYTHWMWKQNLHNMMHLLSLREDGHAQYEIRVYANAIVAALREQLPHSMELYDKYRKL
ncbi:MAG: FAD-dependent thymidylate synthase [Gammaproteobacteria bacterium]|nr:FAD-dependent thymidylate synthase [Gammaproteobacteria bacterium]